MEDNHENVVFDRMVEQQVQKISKFIAALPEDRRQGAAWNIVYAAVCFGTSSEVEAIGLLEDVNFHVHEDIHEFHEAKDANDTEDPDDVTDSEDQE